MWLLQGHVHRALCVVNRPECCRCSSGIGIARIACLSCVDTVTGGQHLHCNSTAQNAWMEQKRVTLYAQDKRKESKGCTSRHNPLEWNLMVKPKLPMLLNINMMLLFTFWWGAMLCLPAITLLASSGSVSGSSSSASSAAAEEATAPDAAAAERACAGKA